jgi:cell wall-associated NlpC family hydrolase
MQNETLHPRKNLTRRANQALIGGLACALFAPLVLAQTVVESPASPETIQAPSVTAAGPGLAERARDMAQQAMTRTSEIAETALSLLGIPYKFGGSTPESGFDCSGLVRFVFQQVAGLALPHSALQQSQAGREVSSDELRPGDLVFFNTRKFAFSHVGIYLGDNKFVHAPRKGKPVQVVELNNPYWQRAFNGARRILDSAPQFFSPSPSQVLSGAGAALLSAPEAASVIHAPLPKTNDQ